MSHYPQPTARGLRLSTAIGLGVIAIAGSVALVVTDGIGGNVRWAHHSGASAAPLFLVAAAITAVSIAHPARGRHALMRLVAVLAFAAWGIAQVAPDPGVAGALNDVAIFLFVVDAVCVVVPDARALLATHRQQVPATSPARGPADTDQTPSRASLPSAPAAAVTAPCRATRNPRCACAVSDRCHARESGPRAPLVSGWKPPGAGRG